VTTKHVRWLWWLAYSKMMTQRRHKTHCCSQNHTNDRCMLCKAVAFANKSTHLCRKTKRTFTVWFEYWSFWRMCQ
jgi:hypothetical protein